MTQSHATRLDKLDKLARIKEKNSPPVFMHWLGHPWTEEEKARAIREHPEQHMFWKTLSKTTPTEGQHLFDASPKK